MSQKQNSKTVYDDLIKKYTKNKSLESNDLLIRIGKGFLNVPYVSNTLDRNNTEDLVINWTELDCTTFVENCIAVTYTLKNFDNPSFTNYTSVLKELRYKHGQINGYSSRNHYMTSWIENNQKCLANISLDLGGIKDQKQINFMSIHTNSYNQLANDSTQLEYIKATELEISKGALYNYIPKNKIKDILPLLRNGDIVVFASDIKGLDYSHIGLIIKEENNIKLLHASSKYKKVIIDPKPLLQYCEDSKSNIGITILRLK